MKFTDAQCVELAGRLAARWEHLMNECLYRPQRCDKRELLGPGVEAWERAVAASITIAHHYAPDTPLACVGAMEKALREASAGDTRTAEMLAGWERLRGAYEPILPEENPWSGEREDPWRYGWGHEAHLIAHERSDRCAWLGKPCSTPSERLRFQVAAA